MRIIKTSFYKKALKGYEESLDVSYEKEEPLQQTTFSPGEQSEQQFFPDIEQFPQKEEMSAQTQPAVQKWKDERWYMINSFDIIETRDGQIIDGKFEMRDMETARYYRYTVDKIRQMTGSTVEEIMSIIDRIPIEKQHAQRFDPDEINSEGNIVRSGSGHDTILHRIILRNGQRHIEVIKPPNTNWDIEKQEWGNFNSEQSPGPMNRVLPRKKEKIIAPHIGQKAKLDGRGTVHILDRNDLSQTALIGYPDQSGYIYMKGWVSWSRLLPKTD